MGCFYFRGSGNNRHRPMFPAEVESIEHPLRWCCRFLFQKFAGHRAWAFKDEEFANKLNKVVTDLIGEPMVLTEYSFARYSPKFGYKPKLFPHYDTHFADGQRITVDIQMNKNVDWAVIVEGESFNFDVNDAFAGE